MKKNLSVIVPVYNEEESLEKLFSLICLNASELQQQEKISCFDVWFIDDGSTDHSLNILKKLAAENSNCYIISFRKNFGKATALAAGFFYAEGDIIITMDADLQDDPRDFNLFLDKLDEGFDLVSGWKEVRNDPWEKRLPSKFFNKVTSVVSGIELHDFNCGFKAYKKEVAKSLKIYGEFHRYLPVLAKRKGFKSGEVVIINHKREFGHSKYGMERYLRGLYDILTAWFLLYYADRPMYFFGKVALISGILAVFSAAAGVFSKYTLLWGVGAMFLLALSAISFFIGLACNLIVEYSREQNFSSDCIKESVRKDFSPDK